MACSRLLGEWALYKSNTLDGVIEHLKGDVEAVAAVLKWLCVKGELVEPWFNAAFMEHFYLLTQRIVNEYAAVLVGFCHEPQKKLLVFHPACRVEALVFSPNGGMEYV